MLDLFYMIEQIYGTIWQHSYVVLFCSIIPDCFLGQEFFLPNAKLVHSAQAAAEVFLRESWGYSRNLGQRSGSALQGPRLKTIEQASDLYGQTKDHAFESKAAEEQAKLLKYSFYFLHH